MPKVTKDVGYVFVQMHQHELSLSAAKPLATGKKTDELAIYPYFGMDVKCELCAVILRKQKTGAILLYTI